MLTFLIIDCETSTLHGKEVLQSLVHDHRDEYDKLTKQECKDIVSEFEEVKATKAKGLRISVKGKVNDVAHTLSAVENEVYFLWD